MVKRKKKGKPSGGKRAAYLYLEIGGIFFPSPFPCLVDRRAACSGDDTNFCHPNCCQTGPMRKVHVLIGRRNGVLMTPLHTRQQLWWLIAEPATARDDVSSAKVRATPLEAWMYGC